MTTTFTPVRSGFYRRVDLFYFHNNLKHNFKLFKIVAEITRRKNDDGNDEFESTIEGQVHKHKLFIIINSINSLISFHIETYNPTDNTWIPGRAIENLEIKKWNDLFPNIIDAVK